MLISQKKATFKNSYGYHRADVLGAILSIFVIWALLIWLIIEAIDRLFNPSEIDGVIMLITSIIGLICNVAAFLILIWCGVEENEHGEKENVIASVLSSYKAKGVRGDDAPLLTASQRIKMSEHSKSSSKNKLSNKSSSGD